MSTRSTSSSASRVRRTSIGGAALRDASSLECSRRSRRTSLGGPLLAAAAFNAETPSKNRHAVLEQYHKQQRSRENDAKVNHTSATGTYTSPSPLRIGHEGSAGIEGSTALERFRMRKLQKQQSKEFHSHNNEPNYSEIENSTPKFSCRDGGEQRSNYFGSSIPPSATSQSNFTTTSVLRPPVAPRNSSLMPPLHAQQKITNSNGEKENYIHDNDKQISEKTDVTETVESAARVSEMQKRVDELMKEKMGITMAMAPLEARFRQKEDAWLKEQNRLLLEIESLKTTGRHADDKYRDLEFQFEAKEEENRSLRLQVRKESSSFYNNSLAPTSTSGIFSRQLQNDRDVVELRTKIQNLEDEMKTMRLSKVSVEKELHATKIELDAVVRSHEELQDEYDELCKSQSDSSDIRIQLEHLKTEHMATSAQLNAVCSDFAATKAASNAAMVTKENDYKREVDRLQFEMSVFKTRAEKAAKEENKLSDASDIEDFAVLKARIEERDRKITELEAKCFEFEEIRRQMHNRIQELRGNIRVFVRARPFLPNDGSHRESAVDVSPDGEALSIFDSRTGSPYDFKFDKVFPPSSGQDQVFDEVSDFVQSALDGYNVCLFSYGQTGSGKTHTMQGSGNGAMRGIIPRAVEQILLQAKAMQNHKWDFKLSSSFLEIYNEELKDLLVGMSSSRDDNKNQKLSIKRSREGKSYVEGLTEIPIDVDVGINQLETLMGVASRSRSVASTKMNAQSSRSHSVFILHLRGYNEETGAEVHGALNLCDLAGSERLDRSGAGSDAQRLRETQAINKSLSCLGDVFNALSQGSPHIPYRNSKLTYLLQDCLSGDGKALMFVNLSPTTASSGESLCSLRFAQRVNQVELGKATKHIQYTGKRL